MRPTCEDEGAPCKFVECIPQLASEFFAQAGVNDYVNGRVQYEAEVSDLDSNEEPEGRFTHSLKVV